MLMHIRRDGFNSVFALRIYISSHENSNKWYIENKLNFYSFQYILFNTFIQQNLFITFQHSKSD